MGIQAIGSGSVMPVGGDIGAEVAELALTASSDQEKQAHLVRDSAEQVEDHAEQSQVDALHDKADHERSAATAAMVGGLVSGACSIGAGALELGGAIKTGPASAPATLIAHGATWGKVATGVGEVGAAVAKKVSGDLQADGADDDAKAAQFDHQASSAKRAADDANGVVRDAHDAQGKALDFLRGYEATEAQTAAAALHRA